MYKIHFPIIFLCLMLAASSVMCSLFTPDNSTSPNDEEKQSTVISLQKTISKIEIEAVTPTVIPTIPFAFSTMVTPLTGSISGKLSYPSENIPPLRIVAIKTDTGEFFAVEVSQGGTYRLDGLPAGKYLVLAYLVDQSGLDPGLAGGYTKFVLCGLQASCSDHSLLDVEVKAGEEQANIDPIDWYAPSGSFPANPTK